MRTMAVMAAAVVLGAGAAAQGQTLPAKGGGWEEAIHKLSSEDFSVRQAGQKDLQKAGLADCEDLEALAYAAEDPEVRQQLLVRVHDIREAAAVNPPPVTLELENATLGETVKALNKAAGLSLAAGADSGGRFTLHAREEPFWEVWFALNRQGSLAAPRDGRTVHMGSQGPTRGAVTGPYAAFAQEIGYERTVNYQKGGAAGAGTLTLAYGVAIDPRLRVLRYSPPHLTSVVDDAGHERLVPAAVQTSLQPAGREWMYRDSVALSVIPGGKEIVSAKGTMHVTLIVSQEQVEVPDMAAHVGMPIVVGGQRMIFSKFQMPPGGTGNIEFSASMEALPQNQDREMVPMRVELMDGAGKPVYSLQLTGGWGGSLGGNYKPPIKGIFSVPQRVKEVDVPFELKNIALP